MKTETEKTAHPGAVILDPFEKALCEFLVDYAEKSGLNYWALILMSFDITSGALVQVDKKSAVTLMDASTRMMQASNNPAVQAERRRKAQERILKRGDFLTLKPEGSA